MKKFRKLTTACLAMVIVAAPLVVAAPSSAAPPPAGYPTNQVMAYGYGSGFKFPIRRGFYDSYANQGFGWDKTYWKHNITSIGAIQFAMGGPGVWQGNDWTATSYANKIVCTSSSCKVTESMKVLAVSNRASVATWHKQPVGGVLGLKTAYCIGPIKCPSWVTVGLSNGGSARAVSPSLTTDSSYQPVTTSNQSYLSYEPKAIGSTIDGGSFMQQQKEFKAVNESFELRK